MSGEDHVAMAREVYDMAGPTYVQFVGTEISPATEPSVDRSLLMAFIELVKRHAIGRVADVGCGPGRAAKFMTNHGLDVIGIDVSQAMIAIASAAHPDIEFKVGQLDALPIETGVLAGAVCWYSIIYTPPDRLDQTFDELARVLIPGGHLLLAFQADGEPVHREDAFGTGLPLTSYRHGVPKVAACLEDSGFKTYATAIRAAELEHESTSQAFVIATAHSRRH